MQAPRLVATDVDGTLLDSADQVPPRAAAAITRLVAAGTGFVLVTGRPPRWIPPIVAQLPVVRLAVCANGAMLYDATADQVVWARTFTPDTLRELATTVLACLPSAGIAVERAASAGASFVADPNYRHAWADSDNAVADHPELLAEPAVKLLVRCKPLSSAEMLGALAPAIGPAATLTYSHGGGLVEISPPGVTKATGLAEVAERAGVEQAAVLAFGDMPNDLEMLRWAGHGVAMGNADPALLEVADEVTAANDDDGIALVLERWF